MKTTSNGQDFVTIVSGLPRSGTSMMMRMLEAGGMPVVTDGIRTADEDNPLGYYEFEAVKRTKEDTSWLDGATGKAVKMVYMLLYDLPSSHSYRVVFMRRNLDEVLASQRVMLQRHGKNGGAINDQQMAAVFRAQLQKFEDWIAGQRNFALHEANYNRLLVNPRSEIEQINAFLGGTLDAAAMSEVINPSLYRNRQ